MKLLSVMVLLMMAAAFAQASQTQVNTLTVKKNSATGLWHATCMIEVAGIDPAQVYSGVMLFQYLPNSATAVTLFDSTFQVEPSAAVWAEGVEGSYTLTAKLANRAVTVTALVTLQTYVPGDRLECGSRIDNGVQPVAPGGTLFGSSLMLSLEETD